MGLTKEQVKKHIAGIEARITNIDELKQYGYEFAKLCFQVKDYDNAIRYLTSFLSVNGRDHRAHKLMGRIYDAVDDQHKAIAHFKRSLDLKKGQRDVIEAVASVYCKQDKPPVDSLKDCLKQIKAINRTHPLIISLSEKIQAIEGGSSVVEEIKGALGENPFDVSLHTQLVKLYCASGKFFEAFTHCNNLKRRGELRESLEWQQCALSVAESYYEDLKSKGGGDDREILATLVSVLEFISDLFNIIARPQSDLLGDSAALLLKFDKVLCACGHSLKSVPPTASNSLFHVALREMCGRLFYMAGRYLYLTSQRLQQLVVGTSSAESILQLGVMCLLSSLKAPPPASDHLFAYSEENFQLLPMWHRAACARISIAGRHLMLVSSVRGRSFLDTLTKTPVEKFLLLKALFGEKTELQAKFGSRNIHFSLHESFLAQDMTFTNQFPDLPNLQALELYDIACIATERELCNVVWRCLAYRALDADPPVFTWLLRMFDGLKLNTAVLSSTEPDTLCVLDIEVFLVLLTDLYSQRLTSSSRRLYSVSSSPVSLAKLSTVLSTCLPSSLALVSQHTHYWTTVQHFLLRKLSVQDAVAVKKVVREFLTFVRGLLPLQLTLEQLTLLARHFKKRAETVVKSLEAGDNRDTTLTLLKWSSHYWSTIVSIHTENNDIVAHCSQPVNADLLTEARMALANAALYRQDTSKALRLYSHVKTAHSAWNQSQIYLHLADEATPPDSEVKLESKLSNLQKAADTIHLAIVRLSPKDEVHLREKLVLQRNEVEHRLEDTKKSPLAHGLSYDDDSPMLPRRSSTPFRQKLGATLAKEKEASSSYSITSSDSNSRDRDIAKMARELQALQAELKEIKSRSMLTPAQSPRPHMSPQGNIMYSPRESHLSPVGLSSSRQFPSRFNAPSAGLTYGLQPSLSFHNSPPSTGAHTTPLLGYSSTPGHTSPLPPGQLFAPSHTSPLLGQFSAVICQSSTASHRSPLFGQSSTVSHCSPLLGQSSTASHVSPLLGQSSTVSQHSPLLGQSSTASHASPLLGQSSTVSQHSPLLGQSSTVSQHSPLLGQSSTANNVSLPLFSQSAGSHASLLTARGVTENLFQASPPSFVPQFSINSSPQSGGSTSLSLPPHLQSHSFVTQDSSGFSSKPFVQPLFGTVQSKLPSVLPVTTVAGDSVSMSLSGEHIANPLTSSALAGLQTAIPSFSPPTFVQPQPVASLFPVNTGTGQRGGTLSSTPKDKDTTYSMPTKTGSFPAILFGGNPEMSTPSVTMPQSLSKAPFNFSSPFTFNFSQSEPSSTQSSGITSGFVFSSASYESDQEPKLTNSFQFSVCTKPSTSSFATFPIGTSMLAHQTAVSKGSTFTIPGSGSSTFNSTSTTSTQPFPKSTESPAGLHEGFPILSSLLSSGQPIAPPSPIENSQVTKNETKSTDLSTLGGAIVSVSTGQEKRSQDQQDKSLDTSDRDPDFAPIVSLPEVGNLPTGEENEDILFVYKAKLYRFNKEWKEKGVGEMKVLKHRKSGKVRLLMRRDQIFKLCCNHYVTSGMSLQYLKDSSRMLCWFTNADFSDGEAKAEKLAIKFKTDEIAAKFKKTVESAALAEPKEACDDEPSVSSQTGVLDSRQSRSDMSSESSTNSSMPDEKQSTSDFISRFAPSAGSWSCNVCMVDNDKSAKQCVACSAEKPVGTVSPLSDMKQSATIPTFGSRFAPPAGSWSCNVCMVDNNKSAKHCVACSAEKTESVPVTCTTSELKFNFISTDSSFKLGPLGSSISTTVTHAGFRLPSSLPSFTIPSNSGSTLLASTCTTSSSSASGFNLGGFSFGATVTSTSKPSEKGSNFSLPALPPSSDTTSVGGFKLPSTLPPSSDTTPVGGFTLPSSLPPSSDTTPVGGFKPPSSIPPFAISNSSALFAGSAPLASSCTANSTSATGFSLDSLSLGTAVSSACTPTEKEFNSSLPVFPPSTTSAGLGSLMFSQISHSATSTANSGGFKIECEPSLTLAASTTSSSTVGFSSGIATGGFKLSTPTPSSALKAEQEDYEEEPDVYFKPLVTLSDAVDLQTGEERTEVLFSHPAKLYRFDSQWKERGTGDIKLLKYIDNDKIRLIMRREHVKKICCNHYLTPSMSLSPMSNSDKAWIWFSLNDFADGVSKPEKFAVKFNSVETALCFKDVFDSAVSELANKSEEDVANLQSACVVDFADDENKLADPAVDSKTDSADNEVVIIAEELPPPEKVEIAKRFQLPLTFFNYEKKEPCIGCRGCIDKVEDLPSLSSTTGENNSGETVISQDSLKKSTTTKFSLGSETASFSDLASSKGSFWFESSKSAGFSRAGEVVFGIKAPDKDDNCDPEAEADVHFKPLVSLPDVQLKTGEEDDECLFSHRAKLYRFDQDIMQWKERGVGDIKITKSMCSNKFRVIMRRDQIRKLCCNHYITPAMDLTPNQGSDRSWVWYTPCDFSEGESKPEKLAVRFKRADSAAEFKKVFDECMFYMTESSKNADTGSAESEVDGQVSNQASESDIGPASTVGSWECTVCMVSNTPVVEKCVACDSLKITSPAADNTNQGTTGLHSPDSSTHRNPLLRFPLNMSPVTTIPYICPKPLPALEKEQPIEASTVKSESITLDVETVAVEKEQPIEASTVKSESITLDVETVAVEKEQPIEASTVKSVSITLDVETVAVDAQDEDVVYLYEELPENDLVEKAKKLMLPPSFYNYEKKEPCLGCRGCNPDPKESLSKEPSPGSDLVTIHNQVKDADNQHPPSPSQLTTSAGFFSQTGLPSFSDFTPSNAAGFIRSTPGFQFQSAGKQLFSAPSAGDNIDPETEADITFKPIISLSETAPVKSWDDDANALFNNRGKLYRFFDSQWKERGVGDIKIMKHKKTSRIRIIMRRDQILKICCNHYITAGMTLIPGSNDRSWVWFTQSDFTDEEPKPEKLAVRFKRTEIATEFKEVFEKCVEDSKSRDDKD